MKDKKGFLSPLFLKYQAEYEKNPRSRVFAPLAELYRKVGMTDRAMEILASGIRYHPKYVLGYLGMASCYYDIQQYSLAYSTLKPFVDGNRDNLKLLKLFADSCLTLDKKEEALDTYKYLLFMNPKERELANVVSRLEEDLQNIYKPIHNPIKISDSSILHNRIPNKLFDGAIEKDNFDPDSWIQLPLNEKSVAANENSEDPLDWMMQKNKSIFNEKELDEKQEREFKIVLDLENSIDSTKKQVQEEKPRQEELQSIAPIITHTLVDLYIGQGHIEKALELLEKILILNPNDQKTHAKIIEINQLVSSSIDSEKESNHPIVNQKENSAQNVIEIEGLFSSKKINSEEELKSVKRYDLSTVESEDEGRKVLMDEISQINVEKYLEPEELSKTDRDLEEIIRKREIILTSFLTQIRLRSEKIKNL